MGNHNPFGLIDSFRTDVPSFILCNIDLWSYTITSTLLLNTNLVSTTNRTPVTQNNTTQHIYHRSSTLASYSSVRSTNLTETLTFYHQHNPSRCNSSAPSSQPPRSQPSPLLAQSTSSTRTALNAPSSSLQTLALRASPSSSSPAPRPPTRPSQPAGLATGTPSLTEPPTSQVCSERSVSTALLAPPTSMSLPDLPLQQRLQQVG